MLLEVMGCGGALDLGHRLALLLLVPVSYLFLILAGALVKELLDSHR
jgi:peptidoglycan biosynthesis protein MviN/MurJ (putative lipid II flippase)